MAARSLVEIVTGHPFFVGLERGFCDLVSGCARNVRFDAGTYLFRKGEPADEFYLVREGRVALQVTARGGETITFQTINHDEIVGLSWLIPPYRWSFDAKATTRIRAIGINATCLRDKCESDHDLGYELMKRVMPVMISRLDAARLQALDVYGTSA